MSHKKNRVMKQNNKKSKNIGKIVMSLLFVVLFVSMISTSIYVYYMGEKNTEIAQEQQLQQEQQQQQIDWTDYATSDFYDAFPKIAISAVTAPIGENIVSAFSESIPDETILYYGSIEDNLNRLLSGECDIVFSPVLSLYLQQQYNTDAEFELIPISNEALVFLVSQKNSIQNLYLEDIQNIYSGQITSWENFTRDEGNIIAYQKPEYSLVQYLFDSFVLPHDKMMPPPQHIIMNDNGELESVLSQYDGGDYAIGYDTYYYANTLLYDYNIKMIAVDGIYPTKKNITRGIYPIMTYYYAIIRKNSSLDSPEQKLVQYLTSQTGQQLLQKSGYIPLN